MAIYIPGKRNRGNKRAAPAKRSAVAVLSLTAMVDMFTVLAVFLLQNYATTDQILYIPEKVELPDATAVKELKPSNVVIVAEDGIFLNENQVVDFMQVREQRDWMVPKLKEKIIELIKEGEEEKKRLDFKFKKAVNNARRKTTEEDEIDPFRKMTIQADKAIDFLTLKKIMYTVTEAGVYEINFAVLKKDKEDEI